jgi:hypothetical protein
MTLESLRVNWRTRSQLFIGIIALSGWMTAVLVHECTTLRSVVDVQFCGKLVMYLEHISYGRLAFQNHYLNLEP